MEYLKTILYKTYYKSGYDQTNYQLALNMQIRNNYKQF